jgi:hypothetical protein
MRSLSWRAIAMIVLALILAGFGWQQYRENRESVRLRVVAENTGKAKELKCSSGWYLSVCSGG